MKDNLSDILNHLGEEREDYYNSVVPPIFQTSNFALPNLSALSHAFQNEQHTHLYTRGNNPTVAILRKKLAALEGTEDALVFASGIAAIAAGILSKVKAGDHIICVENPYSWTNKLVSSYLLQYGVEHSFVDGRKIDEIKRALRPNTKLLVLESPNTMTFELQDLEKCGQWCKDQGLSSIIDNTYCSPLFQNPHQYGIDLIAHSGSKYLNGHSDVVFGALCGSSKDIAQIFAHEFMNLGAILSPIEAFMALRGMRTLEVRLTRIAESTMAIFHFLKSHDKIKRVYYPFDPKSDQFELAKKQMKASPGLISFELNTSDKSKIMSFVEKIEKFLLAVSWGGHESLMMPMFAINTASENKTVKMPDGFIRLYIGLESSEILIDDLTKALECV